MEDAKKNKLACSLNKFEEDKQRTAEENLLRKFQLIDEKGEYTEVAYELVMKKLLRANRKYLVDVAKEYETLNNK
ncbi:MAG: hypothetical protein WC917_03975 [Bacilli bacterium]